MCDHKRFESKVSVFRLTGQDDLEYVTGYTTDIRIRCADCGYPFEFIGLPGGVNPKHPTVNADNTELRAPIRPARNPDTEQEHWPAIEKKQE